MESGGDGPVATVAGRRLRLLVVGGDDHELRIPFILSLQALGFDVAAAGTGDPHPFARNGIPYYGYHFDRFINPLADIRTTQALERIIAAYQPDVIQSFDTKPGLLVPVAAHRTGGVPVVRTINGLGWVFSARSPLALALRPVFDGLHRLTARYAAVTVFQNRGDQSHFRRRGLNGPSESELIAGSGVEPSAFSLPTCSAQSESKIRDELGLGPGRVVMTVTRLSRIKGIPTLLEAARIVHTQRPDVRFVLVGPRESEGPLAIPQKELDRHRPYVIPVGKRADIPALLKLADVFAFPTELSEGVPRVLLEAAMAEVPIVTTAMPGCVDIVQEGESGFVVPVRSPGRLAETILFALANPEVARRMAERAAELVRREYTLPTTVARYAATYTKLLTAAKLDNHSPLSVPSTNSR